MAWVVEFCGVPGAGKTHLARSVKHALQAREIDAISSQHQFSASQKVAACWSYRMYLARVARICATAPRGMSDRAAAFRFVVNTVVRVHEARRDSSDRIYLLDEGPTQRLFMMLVDAHSVRTSHLPELLRLAPKCDLLVHVDEDPTRAQSRLVNRKRGIPRRLDESKDLVALFASARAIFLQASMGRQSFQTESSATGDVVNEILRVTG